jgi:hypothetical protein
MARPEVVRAEHEHGANQGISCTAAAVGGRELPRLAFVHVPKAAGSSITAALQLAYADKTFPAMTTLDYPCFDAAQLQPFRFYKGHAYRRDYERLPPDTRRFTVLRDPFARTISYIRYYRTLDAEQIADPYMREAVHLAKTQSAVEFIYSDSPFVIEHVRLGQVRQFLRDTTLDQIGHRQSLTRELRRHAIDEFLIAMNGFDFTLTREALALSFPLMVAQLGLPAHCGVLPRENVSCRPDDFDPVDVRRAVIDVNGGEFECYEYVRAREMAWLTDALPTARASTECMNDAAGGA